MGGRFWTTKEITVLRELYPQGGITAVEAAIGRTRSSIYQHARALKLRSARETKVREYYEPNAELDAALRLLHQQSCLRGAITAFGERWHRPTWWVSKRARELGLKTPRFREPPWTQAEIDILAETAHCSTGCTRSKLLAAGFRRTECSIVVKRKREGIGITRARLDAGLMTGTQVAAMLGVDGKTPSQWVARFGLRATHRFNDGRAHDDWVIRESDLRDFIITHPARIELRKIPDGARVWFIELLAQRAGIPMERVV